jgi:hypothetical protein
MVDGMEKFVCDIYSKPKLSNLRDARYALFRQKYAPKNLSVPLARIKGADV